MGKSNKAKREKKADFTKVKLKVGKKLPKGQNLTDTSFKSKKIVIGNQLKKQDNETPVTKKKLSLKELLSHLQHFSVYVRQDGLNGLRELLTAHPELVVPSLGQILPALAGLLVDEDYQLRTDTVKLVTEINEQVTEAQIAPFFPALVTHLTCAMTHIRAAVQQSSLPFLATLLRRFPALLSASVDLLLPTLLEQISRSGGGGGARALLADPGSKLSAASWRVTVLKQLAQLLSAQPAGGGGHSAGPSRSVPVAAFCPVYRRTAAATEEAPLLAPPTGQQRRLLSEPDSWREYCDGLTHVLFQAYAEVAPDADKDGSLLSDEAAETLAAVLQVLVEILRQMRHLDATKNTTLVARFTETYYPDLRRHVFASFPFSRLVGRRKKSVPSASSSSAGPSAPSELGSDVINALVCELAASLAEDETTAHFRHSVLDYLTAYLESDRSGELDRVCRLLASLLCPAAGPAADGDLERQLACVRAASERHQRLHPAGQGQELTHLLATLVTEPRYDRLARSEEVEDWAVRLLPSLRPGDGGSTPELLNLLRRMAAMGRHRFVSALRDQAADLLGAAAAAQGDAQWQRGVVELLFWPADVAPDAKAAFAAFLGSQGVNDAVKRYAEEVLQDRYGQGTPVVAAA
ncbi:testis-expressed protein 10 homolog [Amphibalanus amphitrite]|uniref:testis-expressed protein 10 homolog n=1 Tax=Amphibalanus amphitrite TaxID=1232801 RepID=UPI001C90206F|nr:testis-expressed protein 10 homolog [Amphibalanus amphitrite]XP_043209953.1 testis-expressed protein 10 homolog [Amphibalanus amphitrite]